MKPLKSKSQIRNELAKEVEDFLLSGGAVQDIPSGVSGNESNKNVFAQKSAFEPKQDRTPLNDVVRDLENRKQKTRPTTKNPSKKNLPKKKLITDDFGEPVRWVWED